MPFNVRLGDIHAGALTVLPLGIIGLMIHKVVSSHSSATSDDQTITLWHGCKPNKLAADSP